MEDRYLYRAKRTDNGEWVIGSLVWSDDADDDYKAIIIPTTDSGMFTKGGARGDLGFENWFRVDPSTICQCTGLKDKNGKLIFENDLVKIKGTVFQCFWNNANFEWGFKNNSEDFGIAYVSSDDIRIVGNAFDNPELLEVGE